MKLEVTLSKEEVENILGSELSLESKSSTDGLLCEGDIKGSLTNWLAKRFESDAINVQIHWNASGISAIATIYIVINKNDASKNI